MADKQALVSELNGIVGDMYVVHEPEDLIVFEYDGSVDNVHVAYVAYQALDEVADAIASLERYLETQSNNRYTESAENRLAELRPVQEARNSRQ